jgi:hypothetical protein
MSSSRRSYAVTTAVFAGAVVLFGPLSYGIVLGATDVLTGTVPVSVPFTSILASVAHGVAFLVAATVVTEITRVRLHGVAELRRGPPNRKLARHCLLAAPVLAGVVLLLSEFSELATRALERDGMTDVGIVAVLWLLLAWGVGRSSVAFYRGLRATRDR